jgi:hypothetical protein
MRTTLADEIIWIPAGVYPGEGRGGNDKIEGILKMTDNVAGRTA